MSTTTNIYELSSHVVSHPATGAWVSCRQTRQQLFQSALDGGSPFPESQWETLIFIKEDPQLRDVNKLARRIPRTATVLVLDDPDFLLPAKKRTLRAVESMVFTLEFQIRNPALAIRFRMQGHVHEYRNLYTDDE